MSTIVVYEWMTEWINGRKVMVDQMKKSDIGLVHYLWLDFPFQLLAKHLHFKMQTRRIADVFQER